MFDIGFWELLLIGVVGLLVVGPERLPEVARTLGRWVGQLQRMVRTVRSDIERELETEDLRKMLNDQEQQIRELKGLVREVRDETETSIGAGSLKDDLSRLEQEFEAPPPSSAPPPGGEAANAAARQADADPHIKS